MTERERLLEKIRKVQALANRGADGEKQSAAALLDRLMTQYGIDEAEIAEERLEKCFFRYKTPYERKLLVQVIYTVTGKFPLSASGPIRAAHESKSELTAPRRNGWKSNSAMSFIKPRWKRKWNGSIRRS